MPGARVVTSASRSPRLVLRGLGAVLLAIQALVHLRLWSQGFSGIPVIGPLFLAGAVAALVLAVAVLISDDLRVLAAGVLLSFGQIVGFVLASTTGLFGFATQFTLVGAEGAALWSELLAIIVLVVLARSRRSAALAEAA
jgi:hypothetical protein